MKKVITVIISAIAFGLIAGLVMVGVNVFSAQTGIVKNNIIVDAIEKVTNNKNDVATSSVLENNNNSYNENYINNYNGYGELLYSDSELESLLENLMPSVVSITNMQKFKQNGYSIFGMYRVEPQEYEKPASGSGVIVDITDEQVIIITNNHVIESSANLSVTFNDTETVDAAIKGGDSAKDLAIISVAKKDIKPETLNKIKISKIGNSDNVKIGQRVIAIGNALGIGQSVTSGIISAKDRQIDGIENAAKLLQTDAPINPGNSGGALINMRGELIGINVAKSGGNFIEGIGYAIPINDAKDVITTLSKKSDRVEIPENEQGQIGINAMDVNSQIAEMYDIPEGIYVRKINDDSPAKNSELKEKDIIIAFDDQNVKTMSELQELLRYTKAGQVVSIKVKRLEGGVYVEKTFNVTLGKKKVEDKDENAGKNQNAQNNKKESEKAAPNDGQQNNGGEYYYYRDPFEDFEDIFRSFGGFGW